LYWNRTTLIMLQRGARVPLLRRPSTRAMSLLGSIFGIGEFEGARNTSLGRGTGKQQAYDVALLDVSTLLQQGWRLGYF
jgi:hypothetical protein